VADNWPSAVVEIDGIEYQARDFAWESNILQLADAWSVTLPAPNGKILDSIGRYLPAQSTLTEGSPVKFYVSDPGVLNGTLILKMTGRLVRISDSSDSNGYRINVSGNDLGWHLTTGNGRVFQNLNGVTWKRFLQGCLSSDFYTTSTQAIEDEATQTSRIRVTRRVSGTTDNGWGFAGVRYGNLANKNLRLGRALAVATLEPAEGTRLPLFQIEVGQTLGPLMIEFAKREGYLLNVSADGWLQFFKPATDEAGTVYAAESLYTFNLRLDDLGAQFNNIKPGSKLERSAEGFFTQVECWSSVIRPPSDADSDNPNEGRYRGTYLNTGSLPFLRLQTFSDPEQIGQAKVDARAKWSWQRERFNAWEYTFTVAGLSQNGIPYEPDTICEINDELRGLKGKFYISAVRQSVKIANAGFDRSPTAGSTSTITAHQVGFLGA
jgi:hypothetical protein